MACFVPFNSKNLDISILVFRPTIVLVDDLLNALKQFSLCTESLGCVQSSILQSIHGNMFIWFGAWLKRSCENKDSLTARLLSMLANISNMAILVDHSFFDAYAGESRDGSSAAKFRRGDTVSLSTALINGGDINNVSYACLALFKSGFQRMQGATAGVCLKCQTGQRTASLFVWKSLQYCYSWILNSDQRKALSPYLESVSIEIKYDIFRVVYVSGDSDIDLQVLYPRHQMLEQAGGESKEEGQLMQSTSII
ncbi:uncharacterized protein [Pyrus communis]|uniref:uncharacterized protein n=1 Tax=Pyrus communis TaxID=23211 RepID=UPI0035BF12BF